MTKNFKMAQRWGISSTFFCTFVENNRKLVIFLPGNLDINRKIVIFALSI